MDIHGKILYSSRINHGLSILPAIMTRGLTIVTSKRYFGFVGLTLACTFLNVNLAVKADDQINDFSKSATPKNRLP